MKKNATGVPVGRADEVPPGTIKLVRAIDRVGICIVNKEGKFYGVSSVCPHKGASLTEGKLISNSVRCPWHGALFRLDSGQQTFPAPRPLRCYAVRVDDGVLKVNPEVVAPGDKTK